MIYIMYVCMYVVTAVLKAVSLSGGHTVAMELPTSMGIKQSSSLMLTMYEIRDRQDPDKGSGWVLFPSTMTKQPIQQMVVGHLCFQEHAEQ